MYAICFSKRNRTGISSLNRSVDSPPVYYSTIYYSSPSVNDINTAINADLEALRGWLEGNKLSLNVVKTQGMIIGSRCKLHSIEKLTICCIFQKIDKRMEG